MPNSSSSSTILPWLTKEALPTVATLPETTTTTSNGITATTTTGNETPLPMAFTPYKVRNVTLKNRFTVSPMCMYTSNDGYLSDFHVAHYGQFAMGGASLVVVEATAVQANGRITPFDSGLYYDAHVASHKRVVDIIKSQGAVPGIQLGHAGRKASTRPLTIANEPDLVNDSRYWPDNVVGPSAVPFSSNSIVPKEITLEQIAQLKKDFVAAVKRADAAGYEWIEIHGAHGYLISSFLSSTSNLRTDEYGGSFENRIRLLIELVQDIRAVWTKPLSVRISCEEYVEEGWHVDDSLALIEKLIEVEVDVIDCSTGGNNSNAKIGPISYTPLYQVPYAYAAKLKYGSRIHVMAVGCIDTAQDVNQVIERRQADLIASGRKFLYDPHFPMHAAIELGVKLPWGPQYQWSLARAKF